MTERGEPIVGDTILMLLNAHHEPIPFTLPRCQTCQCWERLLDTADDRLNGQAFDEQHAYPLQGRSVAVFRTRAEEEAAAAVIAPAQAVSLIEEARRAPDRHAQS